MIIDLKRTFRKTSVYALGNVATKLIGLILIPLYTDVHYFSVSDYGALGILEITSQVLVAILGLSLAQSLTRWFWDADFIEKQKSVFFTSLFMMVGLSAIIILGMLPLSGFFSKLLFQDASYTYIIQLVLISSGIQVITNHVLALAKLQEKALLYSVTNIIKLTITLGLTIYFIVGLGKKLDGIFEASVIGSALSLVILVPYSLKNCDWHFEWGILKEMLIFGYPLIIASISGVFFSVIDRYFINYMRGLDDVGIYNLGFKLSSTLNVVVITSIQLALSPIMMKKMNDPDNKRFYSKVMTYFSFVLMFCIIGLSLFSLEGIKVFVNNTLYWDSVYVVAILSLATLFSMMKDQALMGLHITKKTKITGTVIVIATGINVLLNALLIPGWGIYGAAIGTLISQIAFFWIIYYKAQQAYYIPFEMNKIYKILAVGVVILVSGLLLNPVNAWIRIPAKMLLLGLYFVALYQLGFFDKVEKETLLRIFRTWKNPNSISDNIKRLMGG
ncbi:MAG: oligosaccharide flippase family protein [Salinivirgaceae bacterium]|nr:oligosaccharide flippase family protein [Salinivirgaceae bacterium]